MYIRFVISMYSILHWNISLLINEVLSMYLGTNRIFNSVIDIGTKFTDEEIYILMRHCTKLNLKIKDHFLYN